MEELIPDEDMWYPIEVGEVLEGTIVNMETVDGKRRLLIETKPGIRRVTPPHNELQKRIKDSKVKLTGWMKIEYRGSVPTRHKPLNLYRVWYADKKPQEGYE